MEKIKQLMTDCKQSGSKTQTQIHGMHYFLIIVIVVIWYTVMVREGLVTGASKMA